jgi:hypothetical protein
MMLDQMEELGLPSFAELAIKKRDIEAQVVELSVRLERERSEAAALLEELTRQMRDVRKAIVETYDLSLLQEVGVYRYRHPLTDVVAYKGALAQIESAIKAMVKKDGGAVSATTNWTVNQSISEGRRMVRDFSKLMLRAFNAEADNLVRGMKLIRLFDRNARRKP